MHGELFMMFALVMLAQACDKGSAPKPADASAPAPQPEAAAEQPQEKQAAETPPPSDVDLATLKKDLGCADKSVKSKHACRILDEFGEAGPWSLETPSGEARWIGYAYVIESGVEKRQMLVVWGKQVPTAEVGAGLLPVKVGVEELPKNLEEQGFKLIRSLSQGMSGSKRNRALPYVESFTTTKLHRTIVTAGPSVAVLSEKSMGATMYLRQPARRKALLIGASASRTATEGDGTYAELWMAHW
jgi:hypothetical protein